MKKIFLISILLICAGLILRFVEIENPITQIPKRELLCNSSVQTPPITKESLASCDTIKKINDDYVQNIKPIFTAKCLMCHANPKTLPLYAKLPFVSSLISHDIEEAQEDFDMRYDFPFRKGGPIKKLKGGLFEIKEVLGKKSMPPLIYLATHWQSRLTNEEEKLILDWVERSKEILNKEITP